VCLTVAGPAHIGAAAERPPQIIPPPTSAQAQRKDTSASGGSHGKASGGAPSKHSGGSATWTTVGGLLAVLALILLIARVLRKGMPAAQRTLPNEVVHVLGRKPLDYRHTIHLIRCGSRLLVVGSSQEGLTTLCEMTDPVEIDYLAGLCKPSEPTTVAESFNQLFRRFQSPAAAESAMEPAAHASSDPAVLRLQERLLISRHGDSNDAHDDQPRVDPTGRSAA
jgi:flagellar biogenesis protein FliO